MEGGALALSDQDLERLADRVAERVASRLAGAESLELVDASAIALRFSLSRSWVYENAERLGVVRIGAGPRARLRFDPAIVRERLAKLDAEAPRIARPARRRRENADTQNGLLPIRGRPRQGF